MFVALLAAAMLAGLMATLLAVMRPVWNGLDDASAACQFRAFLDVASRSRSLSALSVVPVLVPVYRAVAAWDLAAPPPDPRALLRRFHRANMVRCAAALAASVLLFAGA